MWRSPRVVESHTVIPHSHTQSLTWGEGEPSPTGEGEPWPSLYVSCSLSLMRVFLNQRFFSLFLVHSCSSVRSPHVFGNPSWPWLTSPLIIRQTAEIPVSMIWLSSNLTQSFDNHWLCYLKTFTKYFLTNQTNQSFLTNQTNQSKDTGTSDMLCVKTLV